MGPIENLTNRFVQDIWKLSKSDLPASAYWHAKRFLLDYLGVTYAGSRLLEDYLQRILDDLGDSGGEAPLLGLRQTGSVMAAALINGIASHAAELDDGVISGIVHPGAPILSALLPMAVKYKITGRQLLLGIIAGYESTVRLANAIQPAHKLAGFHATATCGAIGGAVGIAIMLDEPPSVIKGALSAAAVSAGGTLKVLEDDSQLKPFNPGHAALSAIISASVARSGLTAPNDVLNGRTGFLQILAGGYDSAALFPSEDLPLSLERVYFKPYAACRYTHPAIEAAFQIRAAHLINLNMIETIQVRTYELAVKHHDHTTINNVSSAKMSIPFSVAVALANGRAGIEDYTESTIADPVLQNLTFKVQVRPNERWTSLFPGKTGAEVTVVMANGCKHIAEVDMPKGEPDNPLTDAELNSKFDSLAEFRGLSKPAITTLKAAVWNVSSNANDLYQLL